MTTPTTVRQPAVSESKPMVVPGRMVGEQVLVKVFVLVPFAWGLGWVDVALAAVFYVVSCLGVTVGYHRYFTHRAFRARRGPRIALAVAGGLAAQGPVISARVIWILEKLGWVFDVRWTNPARLARITKDRTRHSDPPHEEQTQETRP